MKSSVCNRACLQRAGLVLALALAAALWIGGSVVAQGGSVSINRWVLGGGGQTTTGGAVSLHATLGQPVAGGTWGGAADLSSGYWGRVASQTHYELHLPLVTR